MASFYSTIENILKEQTTDLIQVHRSDLLALFKELRWYRRENGIIGEDGDITIINVIGMKKYVIYAFLDDTKIDATKFNISVHHKIGDKNELAGTIWTVEAIYGDLHLSARYTQSQIESKYKVKYRAGFLE